MSKGADFQLIEDTRFLRPPRPFIWQDYARVTLITLAVVSVLLLAFWLIRRRIRRGPDAKTRALRALHRARARRAERGDFWFLLRSHRIFRDFFRDLYGLDAPAQTRPQFLHDLERLPALTESDRAWMEAYLSRCDQLRFAGQPPREGELDGFDRECEAMILRLFARKRQAEAELQPEVVPSPFLPGTPRPDPDAPDDMHHSGHVPDEIDPVPQEVPAQAG